MWTLIRNRCDITSSFIGNVGRWAGPPGDPFLSAPLTQPLGIDLSPTSRGIGTSSRIHMPAL
jgi:hypothetical protein